VRGLHTLVGRGSRTSLRYSRSRRPCLSQSLGKADTPAEPRYIVCHGEACCSPLPASSPAQTKLLTIPQTHGSAGALALSNRCNARAPSPSLSFPSRAGASPHQSVSAARLSHLRQSAFICGLIFCPRRATPFRLNFASIRVHSRSLIFYV
jgi:hypothetical protein